MKDTNNSSDAAAAARRNAILALLFFAPDEFMTTHCLCTDLQLVHGYDDLGECLASDIVCLKTAGLLRDAAGGVTLTEYGRSAILGRSNEVRATS